MIQYWLEVGVNDNLNIYFFLNSIRLLLKIKS